MGVLPVQVDGIGGSIGKQRHGGQSAIYVGP